MDLSFWHLLLTFLLIGFSGLIDSIAGGGGLISVPTYIALGLPAEFILGTNKAVSTSGTSFAVFRYIRGKAIHWPLMIYSIAAALIGSFIGAGLSGYLSKDRMFFILLVIIPLLLVLQGKQVTFGHKDHLSRLGAVIRATLAGLLIGGYDGIFGPGTGTFLLLAFMALLHMSTRDAAANARIVNYASNVSAFLYFFSQGKIYWPLAVVAIAGSICGNWIGSGLVLKRADRVVIPVFRLVLGLLMVKCGYDLFL